MLNKLQKIPVSVRLTALVSEGALECLYMTSKGTKEEWIGINDWPASIQNDTQGSTTYILNLEGKTQSFTDYQSFADCFEKIWIGDELRPWEDCSDDELAEWLDLVAQSNGIPFI